MGQTTLGERNTAIAQPPSGGQHGIAHGAHRATVVEVGGGLREYQVDGFPILDAYGEAELADASRGQLLIPWPNRLADGCYSFEGQTHQLPLSEPAQHNAIHGLVRWSAWDLIEASSRHVRLAHVLWPQVGYPFNLALEALYELSDLGLRVTITAENVGREAAPYGAGHHPYVRAELSAVDASKLRLPAETWLEIDKRQIPTGRLVSTADTDFDFLTPRPIGATRLDTAFTDLQRDDDGLARIELTSSDGSRRVSMWLGEGFDYVMAFTGDTLAEGARRRSIALEPMTCAPDAFRNGLGLSVLEPGQRLSASWGLTLHGDAARS